MEKVATLTSKGQITIPAEIRQFLGLKRGDAVIFETVPDGVLVRRAAKPDAFAAYRGRYREGAGKTRKDINAELRAPKGKPRPHKTRCVRRLGGVC